MPLPTQTSQASQDEAINRPIAITSWLLAIAALLLVLHLRLLLPLLCGLLVHQLVRLMSPLLQRRVSGERARMISVALVASVVIAALAIAVVAAISFLRSDAGSLPHLLGRLMHVIDEAKGQIPSALAQYLPTDATEFRSDAMIWAREHMSALRLASGEVVTGIVHAIIGMVLGGMVSLYQARPPHESAPLAEALTLRMRLLADAFHRVVFAQIRDTAERLRAGYLRAQGISYALVAPLMIGAGHPGLQVRRSNAMCEALRPPARTFRRTRSLHTH